MNFAKKAGQVIKKTAKTITGIKAYEDRKEAKRLKKDASNLYEKILDMNEWRKHEANKVLEKFGRTRLLALQKTVKIFLEYLKIMKYKYKTKEYDLGGNINLTNEDITKLETIEMNASQALGTTLAAGSIASVAISGVPQIVTSVVGHLAAASTGTAISTLHGAAATNATLAWLGGGSIASGGGGVAAGTAVLEGIAGVSAGILALASIGVIASMHYSKKRTEAEKYFADVTEFQEKAEAAWALMDGVLERAQELENVTIALQNRIENHLELLYPLIFDFDQEDEYYLRIFQETAIMNKTMSELSQIPIMDEKGFVSEESQIQINKIEKILNKNL